MKIKKLSPATIRKHKGISFPGVTTVFFCYDGAGRLFLTKRSKNTRDEQGKWEAGGGGLKHGQTAEGNMRRELLEEYNARPLKTDFIGYFDAFRKIDGTETHWVVMCFGVKIDPSTAKINEPNMIDDSGWFDIDNLPNPMHSQMKVFMNKHQEKLLDIINRNTDKKIA